LTPSLPTKIKNNSKIICFIQNFFVTLHYN